MRIAVPTLVFLAACTGTDDTDTPVPEPEGIAAFSCGDAEGVISFETEDGETLVADYHPAAEANKGAIVLLHMAPTGGFSRSDWKVPIRRRLAETGVAILNVDRRGAGESTGQASDAAEGEGGRFDVEAAIRVLLSDDNGCAVDSTRVQVIGASNGTTAAFDYTVAHAPGLPDLDSLVFMSPGTYTENQHAIDAGWDLSFPILWLYPDNEPFSNGFVADAPGAWQFVELGSEHGTQMFDGSDLEVEAGDELVRFAIETVSRAF